MSLLIVWGNNYFLLISFQSIFEKKTIQTCSNIRTSQFEFWLSITMILEMIELQLPLHKDCHPLFMEELWAFFICTSSKKHTGNYARTWQTPHWRRLWRTTRGHVQLGSNTHFNAIKSRHVVSIEENCSLTEKRSPNIHQEKFEKPFQTTFKLKSEKGQCFILLLTSTVSLLWTFRTSSIGCLATVGGLPVTTGRIACGDFRLPQWGILDAWTWLSLFLFWTIRLCFSLIDLSQLLSL